MENAGSRRGRIKLTIGNIVFDGEGEQDWLDQHIDRLIDTFSQSQDGAAIDSTNSTRNPREQPSPASVPLAKFIKETGGDTVQVQRFLATAGWLSKRGEKNLTTSLVSKALQDNHQKRLANASACLNRNVAQGFCEKKGKDFFITPDGWNKLGQGS